MLCMCRIHTYVPLHKVHVLFADAFHHISIELPLCYVSHCFIRLYPSPAQTKLKAESWHYANIIAILQNQVILVSYKKINTKNNHCTYIPT